MFQDFYQHLGSLRKSNSKGKSQMSKGKSNRPAALTFDICVLPFDLLFHASRVTPCLRAYCLLPTALSSGLKPQRLNRVHARGRWRGKGGEHCHRAQHRERQRSRLPGGQHAREEGGMGIKLTSAQSP